MADNSVFEDGTCDLYQNTKAVLNLKDTTI